MISIWWLPVIVFISVVLAIAIIGMLGVGAQADIAQEIAFMKQQVEQKEKLIASLKYNLRQLREMIDNDWKEVNNKQNSFIVSKQP